MTISVPTAITIDLMTSTVVDSTTPYDRNNRAYYQTDTGLPNAWRMQDLNKIYAFIGVSGQPDLYDVANEQTYTVDKVLFKDSTTQKITAVGNVTVLKQPEEYTAVADTTFTFNTWTKPWSKIQTAIPVGTYNGFTKVVDGVTHQLYRDTTSSTGWRYKITYSITTYGWGGPYYSSGTPKTHFEWYSTTDRYRLYVDNILLFETIGQGYFPVGYIYTHTDGRQFKVGVTGGVNPPYYLFKLYKWELVTTAYTYNTEANVYTSLDNTSIISNAYCADITDCADRWIGVTFVLRGTDLYVRTNIGVLETKVVNVPQYAIIYELKDFPNFVEIGSTVKHKPFDGKNYTYAYSNSGSMTYSITASEAFDTVALGNVMAEHILLKFYDETSTLLLTVNADIDTSRDSIGNLSSYQTTLVFYNSVDGSALNATKINVGGRVDVVLTSTSEIRLSTLIPGISARAGMTNLELRNEYKDFSTFEYDTFGNADYIDRARVSKYSGNVDIPITDYDKIDRLMQSLGQNVVIVNGSDNDSSVTDSLNVFASTQKIGRFMSFSQNTKIKENDMDALATYSFTIEEIV